VTRGGWHPCLQALRADPDSEAAIEAFVACAEAEPNDLHRLLDGLSADDEGLQRGTAHGVERLSRHRPELLEPLLRRLFRLAGAVETPAVRVALAAALPRLALGRGEAGRLGFVFETWLDEPVPADVKLAAMAALVELVSHRPELARRVRQVISARVASGSPTIARHGPELLDRLKEF